jgi:hypothetical protein
MKDFEFKTSLGDTANTLPQKHQPNKKATMKDDT